MTTKKQNYKKMYEEAEKGRNSLEIIFTITLILLIIEFFVLLVCTNIGYNQGFSDGVNSTLNNEIMKIKLSGVVEHNYKETNIVFDNVLVCNMTSGRCGNDIYYNDGKGFLWLGLKDGDNGIEISAEVLGANSK